MNATHRSPATRAGPDRVPWRGRLAVCACRTASAVVAGAPGIVFALLWSLAPMPVAQAQEAGEYRLKAAFVYNFLHYVDWPPIGDRGVQLCIAGGNPFGNEIDLLAGKMVAGRALQVAHTPATADGVRGCDAVFLALNAEGLQRFLALIKGRPVLTIADQPDGARQGVMLNLRVRSNRVVFDANLAAARAAGLGLSARLLQLAVEVIQ